MSVKKLFYLFCVGLNQLIALIIFFFQALEEKKIPINRIRLLKFFYFIGYVNMKVIFAVMNTT